MCVSGASATGEVFATVHGLDFNEGVVAAALIGRCVGDGDRRALGDGKVSKTAVIVTFYIKPCVLEWKWRAGDENFEKNFTVKRESRYNWRETSIPDVPAVTIFSWYDEDTGNTERP